MNLPYCMLIQWSKADDAYVVKLPEFGAYASTHGATYDEAAKNGREVLESLVHNYRVDGKALPKPVRYGRMKSRQGRKGAGANKRRKLQGMRA